MGVAHGNPDPKKLFIPDDTENGQLIKKLGFLTVLRYMLSLKPITESVGRYIQAKLSQRPGDLISELAIAGITFVTVDSIIPSLMNIAGAIAGGGGITIGDLTVIVKGLLDNAGYIMGFAAWCRLNSKRIYKAGWWIWKSTLGKGYDEEPEPPQDFKSLMNRLSEHVDREAEVVLLGRRPVFQGEVISLNSLECLWWLGKSCGLTQVHFAAQAGRALEGMLKDVGSTCSKGIEYVKKTVAMRATKAELASGELGRDTSISLYDTLGELVQQPEFNVLLGDENFIVIWQALSRAHPLPHLVLRPRVEAHKANVDLQLLRRGFLPTSAPNDGDSYQAVVDEDSLPGRFEPSPGRVMYDNGINDEYGAALVAPEVARPKYPHYGTSDGQESADALDSTSMKYAKIDNFGEVAAGPPGGAAAGRPGGAAAGRPGGKRRSRRNSSVISNRTRRRKATTKKQKSKKNKRQSRRKSRRSSSRRSRK